MRGSTPFDFARLPRGFPSQGLAARRAQWARLALVLVFHQLHVEAEGLELLDEDVEALGQPGLQRVLALDDRLVDAGSTQDVATPFGSVIASRPVLGS